MWCHATWDYIPFLLISFWQEQQRFVVISDAGLDVQTGRTATSSAASLGDRTEKLEWQHITCMPRKSFDILALYKSDYYYYYYYLTVERLSDGDVALLLEHLSHVEVAARCLYVVYSELLGRVVDLCQHDTTQRNSRPRHRPDWNVDTKHEYKLTFAAMLLDYTTPPAPVVEINTESTCISGLTRNSAGTLAFRD